MFYPAMRAKEFITIQNDGTFLECAILLFDTTYECSYRTKEAFNDCSTEF